MRLTCDEIGMARWRAMQVTTPADDLRVLVVGLDSGVRAMLPFLGQQLARSDQPARLMRLPADRRTACAGIADAADLIFVCDTARRLNRARGNDGFVLPGFVHQVVRTSPPTYDGRPLPRLNKSDRQRFAKQRREHELTWEISRDADAFDLFFDRMHTPMVTSRYGDQAVSENRAVARKALFERGMIFFVCAEGKRVGGILCRPDARTGVLHARLNGLLDGDDRWRQAGVLNASYYYLVQWAAHQGLSGVDLSGSVPFLSRGVYQTKRRLHPEVVIAPVPMRHQRFLMLVRRDSDQVRDFLVANPILVVDDDAGLGAVYFTDSVRPVRADLRSGVAAEYVVDLDADPVDPSRARPWRSPAHNREVAT